MSAEQVRALEDQVRKLQAQLIAVQGQLIAKHEEAERLRQLVERDALTGCLSRRAFDEALTEEVQRSLRSRQPLALLLCDLDHFKQVNDSRGHLFGDSVLQQVAALLMQRRRQFDRVARYSHHGDEFAVLLPGADRTPARRIAEELRLRVQTGSPVTVSIGVAICPQDGTNPADLLDAADKALYRAKGDGRNLVRLASALRAA